MQPPWSLILLKLLLAVHSLTKAHGYTFNNPGKSLVKYTINLNLSPTASGNNEETTNPDGNPMDSLAVDSRTKNPSNVSLEWRYKTSQANTRLLIGSLVAANVQDDINDRVRPLLELKVLIGEGDLCLSVADVRREAGPAANDSQWSSTEGEGAGLQSLKICLNIQGLHDNEWHSVVLELGEGTVAISDTIHRQTLDISQLTSSLLELRLEMPGGSEGEEEGWFVGCLDLVSVSSDKQQDINSYLTHTQYVKAGCIDRCVSASPCVNSGVCIDLYSQLVCDCYGTGYVGSQCQHKDSGEVSLQGKEWLTLNLLSLPNTELYSVRHRLALHFRTVAEQGIVYYAREEYPVYHHVALSLRGGALHVSVVFADQDRFNEVYTAIGTGLDDNRWHSVSLSLYGSEVLVTVDEETEKMQGSGQHADFHVPRTAVFGGMQGSASASQGLKSSRNLVGCLKEIYYNHVSLLDKLSESGHADMVTYTGGQLITSCLAPADACVEFPRDGVFVSLDQSRVDKLVVAMEFKTLKANCLLLHSDLSTVVGGGFIQVSLEDGQLVMKVVISAPQPTHVKVIKIGDNLNDNTWHLLDLYYSNRRMDVRIDDKSQLTSLDLTLQFSSKLYLGFSPIINRRMGFTGCLRSVTLNNELVDPVEILHSPASVGVSLGTCDLVDMCQAHVSQELQCQNRGQCVSEWTDIYCDCQQVFYEGRYCQFGTLQKSCSDLYQSGVSESGVYYISPSGSPLTVYCDMIQHLRARREDTQSSGPSPPPGVRPGVTIVDHNLRAQTQIRGQRQGDLKKVISYRSMDGPILKDLITSSAYCEQTLTFTCSQSPLDFGLTTWMVSPETEKIVPVMKESEFNCDKALEYLVKDTVTIRDPSQLPVTEIYSYRTWGNTSVILSPLFCYGAESELPGFSLTFVTSSSHLSLPWLWKGGLLMVEFRTVQSQALILTQVQEAQGGHTPQRELRLSLRNGGEVEVYLPHTTSPYLAVTGSWLNDSDWHTIKLETSQGEARLIVDTQTFFIPMPNNNPVVTDSNTKLYLGGMPEDGMSVYHLPGFTGCMRRITIQDQIYQPTKYLDSGTADILSGCVSQCDSSPCQNSGQCEEKWTHYYCQCHNPLAHSGQNCENDINTDPVSIEAGHLEFELPESQMGRSLRIIFSFQTRERQAELLHVVLQDSTALSVHLKNGTYITVTLYGQPQTTVQIWMLGLCQGSWKQVLVEINNNLLQMMVDDQMKEARIRGDLSGVGDDLKLVTGADYRGCLRGLQVNGESFSLTQAVQGHQGMWAGCNDRCWEVRSACGHGGECVVHTTSPLTQPFCDCSLTGYAGHYCDRDIGGYFDGDTVLVQWLEPYAEVTSELMKVLFYFSTNVRNRRGMALIKLLSQTDSPDHTSVYLSEECTLIAEILAQGQKVSVESSLSMCDDQPHHVTVTRLHSHLTLLVDDETVRRELPASLQVSDPPGLVIVGSSQIPDSTDQRPELHNFTGNLANVFVVCDQLVISARPLDIASGFSQSDLERVTVYGELQPPTQSLVSHRKQQATGWSGVLDTSERSPGMAGTLDPLQPREAQTVALTTRAGALEEEEDEGRFFHPALIFGICILLLLILAIIIILVYVRHYRKKTNRWAPVDSKKDEEEGLLTDSSPSSPSKDKAEAGPDGTKQPEVTFRSGNKTPAGDKKKSQLAGEEDDEATPMLLSMQPHVPDDNLELNNFQKQINKLPMIDDTMDESSLENEPAVPRSPLRTVPEEGEEGETGGPDSPTGGTAPDQQAEDRDATPPQQAHHPKDSPAVINGPGEEKAPAVSGTSTPPQVKMRHPGVTSDRQALTESQVLDMLDNHEDGEIQPVADPPADTSFSSLPEDAPPCLDLEIQADVHHRTMSFDSETASDTPDPSHRDHQPSLTNGYSDHPPPHTDTHCSDRSLTRIPEESSDKNSTSNGFSTEPPVANGQHSDLQNSHSKDSMKANGPSYVIDSSLNEIHVDNTR